MSDRERVIQRLIELELVQSASEGEHWLQSEKMSAFEKTGAELIQDGYVDVMLEELERVANGGFS